MELAEFVQDFALALKEVDARSPVFTSRTGRVYQAGIGPHSEDRAVDLIVAQMISLDSHKYDRLVCRVPYAGSRQTCDIVFPGEWLIEVKMARFYGDNNKPDDTSLKDLLSPFDADRGAVTDCAKLAAATGAEKRALAIYGFDAPGRPLAICHRCVRDAGREIGGTRAADYGSVLRPCSPCALAGRCVWMADFGTTMN